MKKLSIFLLAMALAVTFAVPAMAIHVADEEGADYGTLGITGRYRLDWESVDITGTDAGALGFTEGESAAMDDDMDLGFTWQKGVVTAFLGLEPSDRTFAGGTAGSADSSATKVAAVDNYYVQWQAMDMLQLKFGEYSCAFGRAVATDGACDSNLQFTYSLDTIDFSGIISKQVEGGEDDRNEFVIMVMVKEAGPFTTLDLAYYDISDDRTAPGPEISYTGLDIALPIGPVGVGLEYGANGGDNDGNFFVVEIGLEEITGFDLNLNYFMSSDDYTDVYEGNDYAPLVIFGDDINGNWFDVSAIWVDASYPVTDALSVNGAVLAQAEIDAGDNWGTEIDAGVTYQFADNVKWQAHYATFSGDDIDLDYDEIFWRLEFKW